MATAAAPEHATLARRLRDQGAKPSEITMALMNQGLAGIALAAVMRSAFGLSIEQIKEAASWLVGGMITNRQAFDAYFMPLIARAPALPPNLSEFEYLHILGSGGGEDSVAAARMHLSMPGYRHAAELLEKGATPVATTIDGHYVLALGDESWIVSEPRAGGTIERHALDWRDLVVRIQQNERVSEVVGWDEE